MDNYFSSREILEKAIGTDAYFQIKSILFGLKAADVAEVKHGRWIDGVCSECGFDAMYYKGIPVQVYTDYCPSCGARMGEEDEHDKHPSDPV